MSEKILVVGIILLFISGMWMLCEEGKKNNYNRMMNNAEHKYIKEMAVDMTTRGEMSGGYLLIAGSFYGTVDTQRQLTVVYSTSRSGEYVSKVLTIPLTEIEIVTIGVDDKPYLRTIYHGCQTNIKLYLPDGWEILKI